MEVVCLIGKLGIFSSVLPNKDSGHSIMEKVIPTCFPCFPENEQYGALFLYQHQAFLIATLKYISVQISLVNFNYSAAFVRCLIIRFMSNLVIYWKYFGHQYSI